jgi:hypothetical protein
MTNYHVVAPLLSGLVAPGAARLRFDYRRRSDGGAVRPGTEFGLAAQWLAFAAPPGPADGEPGAGDLDVAVLRLEQPAGELPIGRSDALADSPRRGWLDTVAPDGLVPDSPLLILQHPQGAPLKLAFGTVLSVNAERTRLRHSVNTLPGSSGSPCLSAGLELVALHHAGDPNFAPGHRPTYNAAVPIAAIRTAAAQLALFG